MKPTEFKQALAGPISSIPTFFTESGAQDLESVRRTVEFAVSNRIGTQVTDEFWQAVKAGDNSTAAAVVDRYDNPYFEFGIGHPKGFHPVQQAAMEVFGRGPRWLRSPQPSLDDGEVEELRAVFERVGVI